MEGHTWAMLFDELEYRYVNSLYRGCEYIPAGMGTAGGGGACSSPLDHSSGCDG